MRSGLPSADSLAWPKTVHVLGPSKIYTCVGRLWARHERCLVALDVALIVSPLCVLVTPQTCVFSGAGPLHLWIDGLLAVPLLAGTSLVQSTLEGTAMDASHTTDPGSNSTSHPK